MPRPTVSAYRAIMSLPTRPYGDTGERVSAIGLGGAFSRMPTPAAFTAAVATIERAVELGVTYFDTSPMYARGASQVAFGLALEQVDTPVMIATKLGYFAEPAGFRSVEALQAQLHENLRMLRRPAVDTLQLHESDMWMWWRDGSGPVGRIDPDEPLDLDAAPAIDVLRRARDEGLCRFIGITGNGAAPIGRLTRDLDVDTNLIAFNYSLVGQDARSLVLPHARRRGNALMVGGIFARLMQLGPDWQANPPDWLDLVTARRWQSVSKLRSESGLSLATLTIRYLLADDWISCILVGASNPAEIEEAVAAAEDGPLPGELHEAIEAAGRIDGEE